MPTKKTIDNIGHVEFDKKGNPKYKIDSKRLSNELNKILEDCILKSMPNVKKA